MGAWWLRVSSPGWSLGSTGDAGKGQLPRGQASTGQKSPFKFQRQKLSYTNTN